MSTWDPSQYLAFEGPRMRPALDLLARVPLQAPQRIVDLGCGPGNVTPALMTRWPGAGIEGVDASPEMLERARAALPDLTWTQADIADWSPADPVDLIYSNAALHWLDDHGALFPRLMATLSGNGALAVQMPRNWLAPSHTTITDIVTEGPWRSTLEPLLRTDPTGSPEDYYEFLSPLAKSIEIWETQYCQIMEGDNPVAEFVKGSQLKRFLDALDEGPRAEFWAEYCARILDAYPKRSDGKTLFPFRRLFIVAAA